MKDLYLKNWTDVESYLHNYTISSLLLSNVQRLKVDNYDFLSKGQLCSKLWLRDMLCSIAHSYNYACVCGGWVGILPFLLLEDDSLVGRCVNIDICEQSIENSKIVNSIHGARAESLVEDMFMHNYFEYDLIINTSFEHISDPQSWINTLGPDKVVCVQSNNLYDIPEHVNCSSSYEEFIEQFSHLNVLKSGKLVLPEYERYMVLFEI